MFDPENYSLICAILPHLLGIIYFFAMSPFIFQIQGLLGKNGILPISLYFNNLKKCNSSIIWKIPSLFWFNASDLLLMSCVIIGTFSSLLLICGFFPSIMLVLLYVIYLSLVSAGQDFLSFGWEGLMLEVTVHVFLISLTPTPNLMVWLSINFLLFRFHIQAGAVKLQSQDPSWRNLTALAVHYETQPIPNRIAWYAYKWPLWFHQLSVLIMFVIELIVPFAIWDGERLRTLAFMCFFALQYFIWLTGNFSYLNYLTVVISTILLSNSLLSWTGIPTPIQQESVSIELTLILSLLGSLLFGLQVIRFIIHFFPNNLGMKKLLDHVAPFHLANPYGIFAVMTRQRYEVVIEGSENGQEWKEYSFRYKPSEVNRHPRRISPYQPRLDWQVWFLPFTNYTEEEWFQRFLLHLLKGTPEVLNLLRNNPFPHHPPKYVRTLLYLYQFSSSQEKKEKGWWWKREFIDFYSPVMQLRKQEK